MKKYIVLLLCCLLILLSAAALACGPRTLIPDSSTRLLTERELKSGRVQASRSVNFAYWPVEISVDCLLTDDPLLESDVLGYVSAGADLTFLATYQYRNGREYAYVSGYQNGQPVCGFIPLYAIDW